MYFLNWDKYDNLYEILIFLIPIFMLSSSSIKICQKTWITYGDGELVL